MNIFVDSGIKNEFSLEWWEEEKRNLQSWRVYVVS